jgi:hypothetical protein
VSEKLKSTWWKINNENEPMPSSPLTKLKQQRIRRAKANASKDDSECEHREAKQELEAINTAVSRKNSVSQLELTRSRQKPSSSKSPAAVLESLAARAELNASNQLCTCSVGD